MVCVQLRFTLNFHDNGELELTLCALEPVLVSFDVASEIGYKRTVSDLPRLRSLLQTFVGQAVNDALLQPKLVTVRVPALRSALEKLEAGAARVARAPSMSVAPTSAGSAGALAGAVPATSRYGVGDKLGLGQNTRSIAASMGIDLKKHE